MKAPLDLDQLQTFISIADTGSFTRAAEELVCGEVSTGAADDLVKATDIARQFVTRFGMSGSVGQVVLEAPQQTFLGDAPAAVAPRPRDYSEATAREIDLAMRDLIDAAYTTAKQLLQARLDDLRAGAKLLLEKETITPADFPPIIREQPVSLHAAARG